MQILAKYFYKKQSFGKVLYNLNSSRELLRRLIQSFELFLNTNITETYAFTLYLPYKWRENLCTDFQCNLRWISTKYNEY